ncbi:hypothetical protein NDU88_010850 [Pleurodeles waltl]|uniref:Uncharacterized protein n=1 Tax=Pleurodeles waltl TaxID=8319 RepID=A0AAV7PWQ9_PLEWA|nr:hypothetical protein NDU88_010850 [Pleurodeles waltl]
MPRLLVPSSVNSRAASRDEYFSPSHGSCLEHGVKPRTTQGKIGCCECDLQKMHLIRAKEEKTVLLTAPRSYERCIQRAEKWKAAAVAGEDTLFELQMRKKLWRCLGKVIDGRCGK